MQFSLVYIVIIIKLLINTMLINMMKLEYKNIAYSSISSLKRHCYSFSSQYITNRRHNGLVKDIFCKAKPDDIYILYDALTYFGKKDDFFFFYICFI